MILKYHCCPNCRDNNLSITQDRFGYILMAICLTCEYELNITERLLINMEQGGVE